MNERRIGIPQRHSPRFDPAGTLERLEAVKALDAQDRSSIRAFAARALARGNLDEALALVEAFPTADDRARGYTALVEALPDLCAGPCQVPARPGDPERTGRGAAPTETLPPRADRRPTDRPGRDRPGKCLDPRGPGAGPGDIPGRTRCSHECTLRPGLLLRIDPATELATFEDLKRQFMGAQVTVRAFGLTRILRTGRLPFRGTRPGHGREARAPDLVHPAAPGERSGDGRLRADGAGRSAPSPQARGPDHQRRAGAQAVHHRTDGRGGRCLGQARREPAARRSLHTELERPGGQRLDQSVRQHLRASPRPCCPWRSGSMPPGCPSSWRVPWRCGHPPAAGTSPP